MENYSSKFLEDILDSIDSVEQAKTDAKMLLAAKIADALKDKGWKKKDLLKALNKENPSIITKWLSGTHNFTVETLIELEKALDIKLLNLSEPEEQIIIYFQSVSQKSQATGNDPFFKDIFEILNEKEVEYPAPTYQVSFNSYKEIAQA